MHCQKGMRGMTIEWWWVVVGVQSSAAKKARFARGITRYAYSARDMREREREREREGGWFLGMPRNKSEGRMTGE